MIYKDLARDPRCVFTSDARKPMVFIHIPKTAGTSLVQAVQGTGLPWLHASSGVFNVETNSYDGTFRSFLRQNAHLIGNGCFRLIFGHFTLRDFLSSCRDQGSFRLSTFLRNPADRLVSEYFYSVSDASPSKEEILRLYPTFDHFIEENTETNMMAHYLEIRRGEDPASIAHRLIKDFTVVGFVEDYQSSVEALVSSLKGSPTSVEGAWLNKTPLYKPADSRQRRRLLELNSRDAEIFRIYKEAQADIAKERQQSLSDAHHSGAEA